MRRSIKLDVRIDLFDEVEIQISSAYSALPKHLLEDLADTVRKFCVTNREELTDNLSTMPTAVGVSIPPRG